MKTSTVILVAVGAGVGAMVLANRASAAVTAVGQGVNPVSGDNWFYNAVNVVGDTLNDGERNANWNLGEALYKATHSDVVR